MFHPSRSLCIIVLLLLLLLLQLYPCYRLLYKDVSTLIFNLNLIFIINYCHCINIVGISNNWCDNFRPRLIYYVHFKHKQNLIAIKRKFHSVLCSYVHINLGDSFVSTFKFFKLTIRVLKHSLTVKCSYHSEYYVLMYLMYYCVITSSYYQISLNVLDIDSVFYLLFALCYCGELDRLRKRNLKNKSKVSILTLFS